MDRHLFERRKRRVSPSLCLAALLIIACAALAEEPLPQGTLSGKVVGPDGKPVTGARVWENDYFINRKVLAEVRTDAEGRFRLGPVKASNRRRLDLYVDADSFTLAYVPQHTYSIFPGVDYDLGTIRLDRGRVFTGQVLDVDGKPRADATVGFRVWRHVGGHTVTNLGPIREFTTDAEGRFRTPPVPVGSLSLIVSVPGRQLAHVNRPIQPGGEEALEPIRLEPDMPISGIVKDEQGRPIAGAKTKINFFGATSDAEGKFTLHGFGPNPHFQMLMHKDGYGTGNWTVAITPEGIRGREVGGERKPFGPVKELALVMRRVAWIEGRAIDADTGEPVRVDKVVICNFQRKPSGEIVLSGCRDDGFEQPETGRFRIAYWAPDEYHLTLTAAGYHDGEAFTPKVAEMKPIDEITVKLKKKTEGSKPEVVKQTITGTVTRDGRPVKVGWVGLWALARTRNTVNAPVLRGRTVESGPGVYSSAPVQDGAYVLDVPFQKEDWYVVVEEPGRAITQVGPIAIALNQEKTLDIASTEGGGIKGRVKDVPPGWEGHLWVVAFSKTAVRAETRVSSDGEFALPSLPPGEYGLKVGHDAYEDSEVPRSLSREASAEMADPWKRAKVVAVEAGRESKGVELELPR